MRNRALIVWTAAALVVAACDPGPAEPDDSFAPLAALYLHQAIDIMEFNSIKRNEIDWDVFRAMAVEDAGAAKTAADTYPAIIAALERLDDGHSFFQPAAGAAAVTIRSPVSRRPGAASSASNGFAAADPSATLLEAGVGYLDVPAFEGGGPEGDSLAASYHALIEGVDTTSTVCRWVVDLRGNTGGNMWPMVAGVGPILGEGTIGFFVDPDSVVNSWFYEDGTAGFDDGVISVADPAYALESTDPHVAVLTDSLTASSGEAVAVAFRGRERTRSFGASTWGVSTANRAFVLPDLAVIFLTVSTMADRDGTLYGEELVPDEAVTGEKTGDRQTDAALDAGAEWLLAQTCS